MHHAITRASDLAQVWLACARLTADSQSVVAMRLMGLGGVWTVSRDETRLMVDEKLPAFTEAIVAGALTAWSGRAPDRVLSAILDPLSRKASCNRRRLVRAGPTPLPGLSLAPRE